MKAKIVNGFVLFSIAAFTLKCLLINFSGFDAYIFTVLILVHQLHYYSNKLLEKLTSAKTSIEEAAEKVKEIESTVESIKAAQGFKKLGQ